MYATFIKIASLSVPLVASWDGRQLLGKMWVNLGKRSACHILSLKSNIFTAIGFSWFTASLSVIMTTPIGKLDKQVKKMILLVHARQESFFHLIHHRWRLSVSIGLYWPTISVGCWNLVHAVVPCHCQSSASVSQSCGKNTQVKKHECDFPFKRYKYEEDAPFNKDTLVQTLNEQKQHPVYDKEELIRTAAEVNHNEYCISPSAHKRARLIPNLRHLTEVAFILFQTCKWSSVLFHQSHPRITSAVACPVLLYGILCD